MWRYGGLGILVLLLTGCMAGPQQLGFSQQQWQAMSEQKRQQLLADYKQLQKQPIKPSKVYEGRSIRVYLASGTAMMPPFTRAYSFETTYFRINPGKCKGIRLHSIDTQHQVVLVACYNGITLFLDPSRYQAKGHKGTVFFDYTPVWKRGFTYSGVTTSGYARLRNASVTIKSIPKVAAVTDVNSNRHRYGY